MVRTMHGAFLPGNSTVELREVAVPSPGPGQVLLRVKASTICGSDIRAIYHRHVGEGPEGYQGVIAGHEPSGVVEQVGPGCRHFQLGDRVAVYHISGCGLCYDCRLGLMVSCTSERREAYGWQRDGGMAPYLLAEEKDLVGLPDELTFVDGALVACGFGTAFEALMKIGVSGEHSTLVTGLGPLGLATAILAHKLGSSLVIGVEAVKERRDLALRLGACDEVFDLGEAALGSVRERTQGRGADRAVDCTGDGRARALAVRATARRGKIALVGEGGDLSLDPSPDLVHEQKTVYGSWVTSLWRMSDLVSLLARWQSHPEETVTDVFGLDEVSAAYDLMASRKSGKVAVLFDDELARFGSGISKGSGADYRQMPARSGDGKQARWSPAGYEGVLRGYP